MPEETTKGDLHREKGSLGPIIEAEENKILVYFSIREVLFSS